MPLPRSARGSGRRGRASPRRKRASGRGVVALIAFFLLTGGLVFFLSWAGDENLHLDRSTLCPKDRSIRPPKLIVIVFDQTDQLPALAREALSSWFRNFLHNEFEREDNRSRSRHSRIEIYSFRANQKNGELQVKQELAVCNPGSVTDLTPLVANPEVVRKRFRTQFRSRIAAQIASMLAFKESRFSPLLEALKWISLRTLSDPRYRQSKKHLIVVSDMVHNTRQMSMFKRIPKFEDFRKTRYSIELMPNFTGVSFTALTLPSSLTGKPRTGFRGFWGAYLRGARADGGRLVRVP